MRLHLCAALALSLALPGFAVEDVASVAEGTVKKIDSSTKTVLIATKDGTARSFHFGDRTAVHGVEAAGKGSEEALQGALKKFDHGANPVTIATADERTFRLLGRGVRDAGRDIEKGADKSAKVGDKVAHFFKSAL
jgi:hypothetical protein